MWWEAGIAAGTAAGVFAYGVRHPASQLFAPSYRRGPTGRPRLALTFDDGPSESTPRLLDVLARHGAAATFFQCGRHVRRLPSIVREVRARGHELGNHTDTHPMFAWRSPAFMAAEIATAQQAFTDVTGEAPRLFRPPYGVRWPGLGGVQRRLGVTSVLWSVIGLDWRLPPEAIVRRVVGAAANGAIICLHDGRGMEQNPDVAGTIQATDAIIARLAACGYEFATASDLLCLS